MEVVCKICRRTIAPGDEVIFQAFGRALFTTHNTCAPIVHGGMRTAAHMVYHGARTILGARAPKALAAIDAVAKARRRLAVNNAQESGRAL